MIVFKNSVPSRGRTGLRKIRQGGRLVFPAVGAVPSFDAVDDEAAGLVVQHIVKTSQN